jgi:hypothetical protein
MRFFKLAELEEDLSYIRAVEEAFTAVLLELEGGDVAAAMERVKGGIEACRGDRQRVESAMQRVHLEIGGEIREMIRVMQKSPQLVRAMKEALHG